MIAIPFPDLGLTILDLIITAYVKGIPELAGGLNRHRQKHSSLFLILQIYYDKKIIGSLVNIFLS